MLIFFDNLVGQNIGDRIHGPATILADPDQRDLALTALEIDVTRIFPEAENRAIRFEARNDYDYVSIYIPDFLSLEIEASLIEVYIKHEYLLILGNHQTLNRLEQILSSDFSSDQSPAQMLSFLFNYILPQKFSLLEEIEDEIEALEEHATLRKPEDHTTTIISLRKQLLRAKRYFEAVYNMLEELEENQNNLFSKHQLQIFRAHKNRASRLLSTVLNLRDYLTQVREAYQNQLDISLNKTMSFFTVIASIFLPLTLLVGWYGMNLRMPELQYTITYPIIIVISIAFIVFSLIFSKRKGWF